MWFGQGLTEDKKRKLYHFKCEYMNICASKYVGWYESKKDQNRVLHTHTEGCHILLPTEFWTLKDGKYPGDKDEKVLDCNSQKYQKAFLSLKVCGKSSIKWKWR